MKRHIKNLRNFIFEKSILPSDSVSVKDLDLWLQNKKSFKKEKEIDPKEFEIWLRKKYKEALLILKNEFKKLMDSNNNIEIYRGLRLRYELEEYLKILL